MKNSLSLGPGSAGTILALFVATGGAAAQDVETQLRQLPKIAPLVYKAEPYVRAAMKLQSMTKDKACEAMLKVADGREHDDQIILLCRMLFTPKARGEFRSPRVGAAHYLAETEDEQWPLSPIELVDGVPFLISMGYRGSGIRERATSYLRYSIDNCNWNDYVFAPRSQQEQQRALGKLLASPKWKSPLDEPEKQFLESQINGPDKSADKDKGDLVELQGTWTTVSFSFVYDGKVVSPEKFIKGIGLVVKGNKYYHGKLKGEVSFQDFSLNSNKRPKEIDFVNVDLSKRTVKTGIYELEGDRLRICCGPTPDERPTSFEVTLELRQYLWEFKRMK